VFAQGVPTTLDGTNPNFARADRENVTECIPSRGILSQYDKLTLRRRIELLLIARHEVCDFSD
jgi:hypothetical protein